MLKGNKLYDYGLQAPKTSGEVNYSPSTASYGSSYTPFNSTGLLSRIPKVAPMTQPVDPYAYMDVPPNNPYKTVANYQKSLTSVGQSVPQRMGEGLGNVLMTALDLMQRPQYAVTNVLDEVTDDKKSSFKDVLTASLQGITGERKSSTTDVFDNLGWKNNDDYTWYGKSKSGDGTWNFGNTLRNTAGLAGDILLDPTTYMGGGAVKLSQVFGAKGIGTKTDDVVRKLVGNIPDVGKKPIEQSIDAVHNFLSRTAESAELLAKRGVDDVAYSVGRSEARNAAKQLADDALKNFMKHTPEQQDVIIKLADAIGMTTDSSSQMLAKNQEIIHRLMDKGLDGINSDTLKMIREPLERAFPSASLLPAEAEKAFNRSAGQIIGKKLSGAFDLPKALDQSLKTPVYKGVMEVLTGKSVVLSNLDHATKLDTLRSLYKNVGSTLDDVLPNLGSLADTELEVVRTLLDVYGGLDGIDPSLIQKGFSESVGKLAGMAKNPGLVKRMTDVTDTLLDANRNLKRIQDGIEFSNGLQRVFDATNKSFYIRYHNPFTGTIKPMFELTSAVKSDVGRKAWDMIVSGDLLSPVVSPMVRGAIKTAGRGAELLGVGLMNTFSTEAISKRISRLPDGSYNKQILESAQAFSRMVTTYMRQENALPRRAMESLKMFAPVKGFFDDINLRKASSAYIIRDRSPIAGAAWAYISGADPASLSDEIVEALQAITTTANPRMLSELNTLKASITPERLDLLKKAAGQNTLYNQAITQYDSVNNIAFADSLGVDRAEKVTAQMQDYVDAINEDLLRMESYIRQYHDTPPGEINPLATPTAKETRDIMGNTELNTTRLGQAADPTSTQIKGTSGAFMKRKYQSHWDVMYYNPEAVVNMDLGMIVARRTLDSERVVLNKRFVQSIEDSIRNLPDFDRLVSTKSVNGFEYVPVMGGAVEYWAHPEIANQIRRVTEVFNPNSQGQQALFAAIQEVSNALKSLQTKWNPSFNWRNLLGEPLMCVIGGVSPANMRLAKEIMNEAGLDDLFKVGDTTFARKSTGDVSKLFREYTSKPLVGEGEEKVLGAIDRTFEDASGSKVFGKDVDIDAMKMDAIKGSGVNAKTYNINGKEYTSLDIMNEFYNVGLGWSGVTKGNLAKNIQGMLEQEMFAVTGSQKGIRGKLSVINEKVGKPSDFIETWSRLSHYIDARLKGMGIDEAALEVRKYHVDYKDLTRIERNTLRNILPYYTYMRKNLPMQVNLLLERQNMVNMVGQLVDSSYEAIQRDNGGKPLVVPDYLKEGLAIPLSVDEDGNVNYLNWGIPIADVGRLKYNMEDFMKENFFSMLSPMIKTPLEMSMNQTMLYDSQIQRYEGEKVPLIPGVEKSAMIPTEIDQILQNLGIINTSRKALSKGVQNGIGAGLRELLVGSIMPQKNQGDVAAQQAYDYRDQLYGHIQRLRAEGTYVPSYTPPKKGTPVAMPMQFNTNQGYLGVPNDQLYYPPTQRLLEALLGGKK